MQPRLTMRPLMTAINKYKIDFFIGFSLGFSFLYLKRRGGGVSKGWVILSPIIGGVQKQCHVADFETYVLIFVHCASKSASSTLFYHPHCKNRKPKICFLFFCFKWGKNSIMGNLLPRTLGLRGGMQAIGFRLARLQILCYDCFMFNLKDKFYVCGD